MTTHSLLGTAWTSDKAEAGLFTVEQAEKIQNRLKIANVITSMDRPG